MIRRRAGRGRIASLVLVTGVLLTLAALTSVVDLAAVPVVVRAEARSLAARIGLHDAVIKSSPDSNADFVACGAWADLICKDSAPDRRELAPGENTRTAFGWPDADGFLVAPGCTMRISGDRRSEVISGPRWFKVVGFFGLTQELTYTCSR